MNYGLLGVISNQIVSGGGVPTDYIAYYPFNGNTNDESGNGNILTNNGATLTTDRLGNSNSAYEFNGTSSYMVNTALSLGNVYSFCFWAKQDSIFAGEKNILSASNLFNTVMGTVNTQVFWYQQGLTNLWSTTHTTNWEHICIVSDGNNRSLYINGVLDDSQASYVSFFGTGFYFGRRSDGINYWNGKLDDIRIYDRALSGTEVLDIYNYEKP